MSQTVDLLSLESSVVKLSGDQDISGTKNFTGTLQVDGESISSGLVKTTGDQDITGTKTFLDNLQVQGGLSVQDTLIDEQVNNIYIFTGSTDDTVRKIDPSDMSQVGSSFVGHTSSVYALAYGADGYLYSGSLDDTVRKIDTSDMSQDGIFDGHTSIVYALAYGADGYLYSASLDDTVRKIDPSDMSQVGSSFVGHTSSVYALAYGADGYLYSGSADDTVRKIDTSDMSQDGIFDGHTDRVYALAYGADGYLYSGSADDTVRKIDTSDMSQVGNPFEGHINSIRAITNSKKTLNIHGNTNVKGNLSVNGSDYRNGLVKTTGDQDISGTKNFTGNLILDNANIQMDNGDLKLNNSGIVFDEKLNLKIVNTHELRIYLKDDGQEDHYAHFSPYSIELYNPVYIRNSLSKNSGSFKIDHPLPEKKDTHYLVHSFTESPKADLYYSGMARLGDGGTVTINIDDDSEMTRGTLEALTCNRRRFCSNEEGWTAVKSKLVGADLTITAQDPECRDEVFWLIIGERCDPHMKDNRTKWTDENGHVIVEPQK